MKLYKKCLNDRYRDYHELAKEYLLENNINCKYYMWCGMFGDIDLVKTDKGIFKFDIKTRKVVK